MLYERSVKCGKVRGWGREKMAYSFCNRQAHERPIGEIGVVSRISEDGITNGPELRSEGVVLGHTIRRHIYIKTPTRGSRPKVGMSRDGCNGKRNQKEWRERNKETARHLRWKENI